MTESLFENPRLLIERAREHINKLNERGRTFAATKPYTQICDFDRKSGEYLYGVRVTAKTPASLSLDAADALNNLRSALDQALCASVGTLKLGSSLNGVSFPFGDNEDRFNDAIKGGCKKSAPEIVAIIRELKPYKGGNDPLWVMNTLSKTNRHRMLQPVVLASDNSVHIKELILDAPGAIMAPFWNREKNQIIFARSAGKDLKYDIQLEFHIAFGDIEFVADQPAIPILYGFCDLVAKIVSSIETETTRIASDGQSGNLNSTV